MNKKLKASAGTALVLSVLASSALARDVFVEASPQDRTACGLSVGLDLGAAGLVAARRPGALEAMAAAWLEAGDAGNPTVHNGLTVDWDGRFLSLRKSAPCEGEPSQLAALLALVDRTRELTVPYPAVRAWVPPPELAALRRDEALHRATAAALGASETAGLDEEVHEMLVAAMRVAPVLVRARGLTREVIVRRLPKGMKALAQAAPAKLARFEPRTLLLAPQASSVSRFWIVWRLEGPDFDRHDGHDGHAGHEHDARSTGPLLESLLGHRGHRLSERLINDWGLVDELAVVWLAGPSLLVVSGAVAGDGFKAPVERVFVELAELAAAMSKRPASEEAAVHGAWLLALARHRSSSGSQTSPSPQTVARLLSDMLTRDLATVVVEPMRDDPETAVAVVDAELITVWTAATLDMRCPAPDERRDKNTLLLEEHGLDARRYLAMSRALGRDAERMRLLDRELVDRCAEDTKLRGMLVSARIIAMHREIRCGRATSSSPHDAHADDAGEVARRRKVYRRFGIDSSVHRPLIRMARRSPTLRDELTAIDLRCPEAL